MALKILSIEQSLPLPEYPQAKKPSSGSIKSTPRAFRLQIFSCNASFLHILTFIAGAIIIGFVKAQATEVKRLSATEVAIFEIVFAVGLGHKVKYGQAVFVLCQSQAAAQLLQKNSHAIRRTQEQHHVHPHTGEAYHLQYIPLWCRYSHQQQSEDRRF